VIFNGLAVCKSRIEINVLENALHIPVHKRLIFPKSKIFRKDLATQKNKKKLLISEKLFLVRAGRLPWLRSLYRTGFSYRNVFGQAGGFVYSFVACHYVSN